MARQEAFTCVPCCGGGADSSSSSATPGTPRPCCVECAGEGITVDAFEVTFGTTVGCAVCEALNGTTVTLTRDGADDVCAYSLVIGETDIITLSLTFNLGVWIFGIAITSGLCDPLAGVSDFYESGDFTCTDGGAFTAVSIAESPDCGAFDTITAVPVETFSCQDCCDVTLPSTLFANVTTDTCDADVYVVADIVEFDGSDRSRILVWVDDASGGTCTVTVDYDTLNPGGPIESPPIAWDATAADFLAAVGAPVDPADILDFGGSGTTLDPWYLVFSVLGIATITGDGAGLTCCEPALEPSYELNYDGDAWVFENEITTITLTCNPGSTWTLVFVHNGVTFTHDPDPDSTNCDPFEQLWSNLVGGPCGLTSLTITE